MVTKVSGSYVHNVICDICGRKMKASELQKRWDGYMVCDKDWEPRNILDFYRVRNDVHQLDWTRSDDAGDLTWTVNTTHFTQTPGLGTCNITSSYSKDLINNKVNWKVQFNVTADATIVGDGFINTTITLPIQSVSAGTWRLMDDNGRTVLTGTIGVGVSVTNTFNSSNVQVGKIYNTMNMTFIGQYGI